MFSRPLKTRIAAASFLKSRVFMATGSLQALVSCSREQRRSSICSREVDAQQQELRVRVVLERFL